MFPGWSRDAMNSRRRDARILIIDDDRELGEMVGEFLAPDHLALDACVSGEDGLEALRGGHYDLLILDIMLPGMSGIDVLREIRQSSDIPVIMLTARGDDVDRILGLEFGADDYLSKPFNPRELLARIKAIMRRSRPPAHRGHRIRVGAIELDVRARRVSTGGESIRLTGTEFELLRCLAEAPGEIVSKEHLSREALGRRHMPYDRSIDTHVSNVRGKLTRAGVANPSIQSRRGVGYCLLVDE
jgi:two-component system response regulator CpxR